MTSLFIAWRSYRAALGTWWRASTARPLYHAWLAELWALLPAFLRARLDVAPDTRRIDWPLVEALEPGTRVTLVLPGREVLCPPVSLPAAAARDLRAVLGFEMDRYVPYPAQQLYYDARVVERQGDKVRVQLVVIPQARLDTIIQACHGRGLTLAGIDARADDGRSLAVDLLPPSQRPRPAPGRFLDRGLAWLAAALLLLAMLGLLHQRDAELERMQQAVQGQRQALAKLEAVRRELLNTEGAATYLAGLKAARAPLASVLADLSQCLDDDTWLEQLEVSENGELSMSGQSSRASSLISQLKQCRTLGEARFQGVIQPDAGTGRERFSLIAQLTKEPSHGASPDQP
ncbi:PilN domain-containing protein [Pseudomonas massiliensis]|uniref:PilN domain-containing protein n=1 Tax=Pseudomonas massiliensis TaxID=522492 RepID=UPI00058EBD89|nr:type II secretion system protein GspL [Pseudomonas massiliensis]